MTSYVIRFANYLEELEITDFENDDEAKKFAAKEEDPKWTAIVVYGPSSLRRMSPVIRKDIYNLIVPEGEETPFETMTSGEDLFARIETWMKE